MALSEKIDAGPLQNIVKEGLTRKIFRYKDLAGRTSVAPKHHLASNLAVRMRTKIFYARSTERSVMLVTSRDISWKETGEDRRSAATPPFRKERERVGHPAIGKIGINKCGRESGFDRKNFVRKLVRGLSVKRNSYPEFVRWLEIWKAGGFNLRL